MKNCVSIVCEFASSNPRQPLGRFHSLPEKYTLSERRGREHSQGTIRLAFTVRPDGEERGGDSVISFRPSLRHLEFVIKGRGIIGAVAAIPFYTRFDEALSLWTGPD